MTNKPPTKEQSKPKTHPWIIGRQLTPVEIEARQRESRAIAKRMGIQTKNDT